MSLKVISGEPKDTSDQVKQANTLDGVLHAITRINTKLERTERDVTTLYHAMLVVISMLFLLTLAIAAIYVKSQ